MKIPSEQLAQWVEQWWSSDRRINFPIFMAEKSAEWMRDRCARACDELRVKGGEEWGPDHLVAVKALTDASVAIRALTGEEI